MKIGEYNFVKRLAILLRQLRPGAKYCLKQKVVDKYNQFRKNYGWPPATNVYGNYLILHFDKNGIETEYRSFGIHKISEPQLFCAAFLGHYDYIQQYSSGYLATVIEPFAELLLDLNSWEPCEDW